MYRISFKKIVLLSMLLLIISGCNQSPSDDELSGQITTTPNSATTQAFDQGYPGPIEPSSEINNDPGYPAPETSTNLSNYPDAVTIPTVSVDYGIVVGQLVVKNNQNTPYLAPSIYLGKAVEPNLPEYPPLISLDEESDSIAVQDKSGKFVFSKIIPGKYGLIIWSPFSQTVMPDPEKEGFPLLVEVSAGTVVDLGVIEIP